MGDITEDVARKIQCKVDVERNWSKVNVASAFLLRPLDRNIAATVECIIPKDGRVTCTNVCRNGV